MERDPLLPVQPPLDPEPLLLPFGDFLNDTHGRIAEILRADGVSEMEISLLKEGDYLVIRTASGSAYTLLVSIDRFNGDTSLVLECVQANDPGKIGGHVFPEERIKANEKLNLFFVDEEGGLHKGKTGRIREGGIHHIPA